MTFGGEAADTGADVSKVEAVGVVEVVVACGLRLPTQTLLKTSGARVRRPCAASFL